MESDVRIARASRRRPLWRWVAAVVVALVVSGLVLTPVSLGDHHVLDRDGDGLPNEAETAGWSTEHFGVLVTDPNNPDSDGDGLFDGEEAGALATGHPSGNVYIGISNPGLSDTDGDRVGDAEEYFLDMNAISRDTDADGLTDDLEVDFESDPTRANPDGDSFDDKEEYERGSDPLAYDLDRGEAIAAFIGGATFGDSEWSARNLGRMRDEQLQSPEYLAGQFASGVAGVGDLRDLVADVRNLDFVGAVESVVALVPAAGDTVKAVAKLVKFANRGDRAELAAYDFAERLPWSKSTKKKVLDQVFGRRTIKLPHKLVGGPNDNVVYVGRSASGSIAYCGITNNFDLRQAQHNGRGFTIARIPGAARLERGEARAIEEACITRVGLKAVGGGRENKIHSIDPAHDYYGEGLAWGTHWWMSNAQEQWVTLDGQPEVNPRRQRPRPPAWNGLGWSGLRTCVCAAKKSHL